MSITELLRKVRPSELRSQLILGITFILTVSISLFVIDMVNRQKAFFINLNHDRGLSLSDNLANFALPCLVTEELAGLQSLIHTYKKMPGLDYAMVTSPDGIVLAHTNSNYLGLRAVDSISMKLKPLNKTQILIEDNQIFDVASPIIYRGEIIGWARIGISQTYVEINLLEIKKRGILYILVSLIVGILFAIIVAGRLSKGLQQLVMAAQQIKAGKRDLRVSPSYSDEVTELGTAMNQMLDDISANEKLLSMVLENMPVGVFILDEKGKIVSLNPAAQKIWERARFVNMDEYSEFKGWFPDTGKEIKFEEWGANVALKEQRPVLNQEAEIEDLNGNRKTILNSWIPLQDSDKKMLGLIAINVDITARKRAENELRRRNNEITERVKELRCLYRMSELSNDTTKTLRDILKECVELIPPSYQYPEITCARIEFEGQVFESTDFMETQWVQEQAIASKSGTVGKVQVYYKQEMPPEAEGPFLSEERFLIISIADILGSSAERKRAEEQIRISEERYKSIITVSNTGAWEFNSDNGQLWCSPEYFSMLGRSQSDYESAGTYSLDEVWINLLHPDDVKQATERFAAYMEGGSVGMYENYFRLKNSDGSWTWIWSRGQTMRDKNGKKTNITVGTHIDITESHISEEKLKRSEEKNRALIENISDTIILLNEKGEVLYQSPAFIHTAGFSTAELKGKTVFDFFHPEDIEGARQLHDKAMKLPGVPMPAQYRIKHRLGHYIWVEGTILNLLNNESVGAIIINYRDVSERKKFEEQQLLITSIVDSSDDAIISKDLNGIITSWNKGAAKILGYHAYEMVGRSADFLVPEEFRQKELKIMENIRNGSSIDHFQSQRIRKDGAIIFVSLTISPIRDVLGNVIGAAKVMRDVTEQKKTEEDLIQMNKKLRQLSYYLKTAQEEERTRISREIHDELGQQLTGLKMDAFLVTKNIDEDKEKAKKKIKEMVFLIDFTIKTVRRIASDLRPGVLDDLGLMSAIEWQGQEFVKRSGVELEFESALSDLNPERTLSTNIFRIYQEILTNVTRHADATLVKTNLNVVDNQIILVVEDNGKGFNLEEVKNKGSLGLLGMKERVLLFNGELIIDSKKGKGTIVTLKAPFINS